MFSNLKSNVKRLRCTLCPSRSPDPPKHPIPYIALLPIYPRNLETIVAAKEKIEIGRIKRTFVFFGW